MRRGRISIPQNQTATRLMRVKIKAAKRRWRHLILTRLLDNLHIVNVIDGNR